LKIFIKGKSSFFKCIFNFNCIRDKTLLYSHKAVWNRIIIVSKFILQKALYQWKLFTVNFKFQSHFKVQFVSCVFRKFMIFLVSHAALFKCILHNFLWLKTINFAHLLHMVLRKKAYSENLNPKLDCWMQIIIIKKRVPDKPQIHKFIVQLQPHNLYLARLINIVPENNKNQNFFIFFYDLVIIYKSFAENCILGKS
jgi:hypothetical protein